MAKTLDYDFTDPQFDGVQTITAQTGADLTVARAADATVMDYFNVLKTVGNNEPRFTGGRRVENLCLQSADLSTTWTTYNGTDTVDQANDPVDAALTADLFGNDAVGAATWHYYAQTISMVKDSTYAQSVYLKKVSGTGIVWLNCEVGADARCYFNLTTGAVGTEDAGVSGSIEDVGNGWYRCSATYTKTSASGNEVIGLGVTTVDGTPSFDSTGIANQEQIYVWGFQLEDVTGQDDPAPSEYIATTTATKAQWYATKRRTNLCLQSNDFDTKWTNSDTVEAQGATDPDGGSTAWTITDDSGGDGPKSCYMRQTFTIDLYTSYTFSVYAKADQLEWMRVDAAGLTGLTAYAFFHLSGSGTVGATGTDTVSPTIESIGNGWYRCSFSFTTVADGGGDLRIYPADGNSDISVDMDGTSSIQVYGAQLERGSTATAYIATTDAVASSDFDTAITPTGLLIEEARTNLVTWTESFDNASWVKSNLSIIADQITAPDGTLTADELIDNGTLGYHSVQDGANTVSSGSQYTISAFIKAGTLNHAGVYASITPNAGKIFDLSAGAVLGNLGAAPDNAGIQDCGNGWFRCWITVTTAGTSLDPQIYIYQDATTGSYSGIGDTIYAWGAQLEAGSFVTSYIPNDSATASVTRAADVVTTSDVTWQTAGAGTFYMDVTADDVSQTTNYWLSENTSRRILYASNQELRSYDSTNILTIKSAIAKDTNYKVALGYADADLTMGAYLNGVASLEASETYKVGGFDLAAGLGIGNVGSGADSFDGHISRIVYYDERLDDATLEDYSLNGIPVPVVATGMEVGDDDWFRRRRMLRRHRRLYARR